MTRQQDQISSPKKVFDTSYTDGSMTDQMLYNVAVMGERSSGKSTLIDYLLKVKLCPSL